MDEAAPLIVAVDDDAAIRELLETYLGAHGFRVVACPDASSALAAIEEHHADAVVLDMGMDRASGLSVLTHLRSEPATRDLPVVVHSGVREDDEIWAGERYDWNGYFTKPADLDLLASRLHELIAARRA